MVCGRFGIESDQKDAVNTVGYTNEFFLVVVNTPMKIHLTTCLLLTAFLFPLFSEAQIHRRTTADQYYKNLAFMAPDLGMTDRSLPQTLAENGVEQIELNNLSLRNGKSKSGSYYLYKLDDRGRVVEKIWRNKSGKLKMHNFLVWEEAYVQRIVRLNNRRDTVATTEILYHNDDLISIEERNKTGRQMFLNRYQYADSLLTRAEIHKKGKLNRYWVYAYHPDGSRKETNLLNGKGKLKGTWSYACKEEGVEMLRHKDTSTVCIEKTGDPLGNVKEVWLTTDPDGKVRSTVLIKNSHGKLTSMDTYSGMNKRPVVSYKYGYLSDTVLVSEYYQRFRKGLPSYESVRNYDVQGKVKSTAYTGYRKGKQKSRSNTEYLFDGNGLPVTIKYLGSKSGRLVQSDLSYVRRP